MRRDNGHTWLKIVIEEIRQCGDKTGITGESFLIGEVLGSQWQSHSKERKGAYLLGESVTDGLCKNFYDFFPYEPIFRRTQIDRWMA